MRVSAKVRVRVKLRVGVRVRVRGRFRLRVRVRVRLSAHRVDVERVLALAGGRLAQLGLGHVRLLVDLG